MFRARGELFARGIAPQKKRFSAECSNRMCECPTRYGNALSILIAAFPAFTSCRKTAWVLLTKKAGRTIGFVTSEQFRKIEGEDAEMLPTPSRETKWGA